MTWHTGQPNWRVVKFWTQEKNDLLLELIGYKSYDYIASKLGVSIDACRKQASRLGHRLDQGTTTLRELARDTGYDRHQLRRARNKLGQTWHRVTSKRYNKGARKLLIRTEQANELIDYLKLESVRHDRAIQ
jgi:hypothetical protein